MLKHGILGLISYGDKTGYEIKAVFRDSLRHFWPVQTSQIYRELRALEARKLEAPDWKLKLPVGIVNIGFAAAALVFGLLLGNMRDLTWIYAAGLIYSALENLISAFRKTAIVYIP